MLLLFLRWAKALQDMSLTASRVTRGDDNYVVVNLTWDEVRNSEYYLLYKSYPYNTLDEWEMMSTFDFESNETLRVLNMFPEDKSDPCRVINFYSNMTFRNGTTKSMPRSAQLKIWMEGGTIGDKQFDSLVTNPLSGHESIEIVPLQMQHMNDDPSLIWNYDVVVFGMWDGGGFCDVNVLSPLTKRPGNELIDELSRYIKAGHGVITTHDTVGTYSTTELGFGRIRHLFRILVGGNDENVDLDPSGTPMTTSWGRHLIVVDVAQRGRVTDFPWKIPDRISVLETHASGLVSMGNNWIIASNGNSSFPYDSGGFPDGFDGPFMSTADNTAVIQTGHYSINAHDPGNQERKVWANLLHYMKKRTRKTVHFDHFYTYGYNLGSALPLPTVQCWKHGNDRYEFLCYTGTDGAIYRYRVAAYNSDNEMIAEGSTEIDVSEFSHFVYRFYDTEEQILSNGTGKSRFRLDVPYPGKYFELSEVWKSGNVGLVWRMETETICKTIPPSILFASGGVLRKRISWIVCVLCYDFAICKDI